MFSDAQKAELAAKLDASAVKSRTQAGRSLSYIEGWHAIAEANRIFGYDGWMRETVDIKCVSEKERKIGQQQRDGWGVTYVAKVRVNAGDIIREGVGAGHGIDVDLGQAHESAIKEAETDAMKRALMTFGNPFGLALYDKSQANVEACEKKKPNGVTFWERESYHLANTKSGKVDWQAWDKAMHRAIGKCPDLDALTKLQVDNQPSINTYRKQYEVSAKALLARFAERMAELSQGPVE